MQGMSERAYAAHAGISRGAVQKAKDSGRLVLHPDGSIDAAASDRRRRETTDPARRRGPAARAEAEATGVSGDGTAGAYLKARTMNEVLKAQERKLAIERRKGALVDRARAERLVFRMAREDRDAWISWPARAAALIAAELSAALEATEGRAVAVETAVVQAALEKHVRAQLDSLAEIRAELGGA